MAGAPTSLSATEQLLIREEIDMLMVRYCYCVDHKDWDTWETLFTPDAVFDEHEALFARHPVTNETIPCPTSRRSSWRG